MSEKTITTHKSRFQNLRDGLLSDWHILRWLRLAIGLFFLWQMSLTPDVFTGLVAGIFLFQAITNTGCCGASGCSVPRERDDKARSVNEEIEYEEIKERKYGRQENI